MSVSRHPQIHVRTRGGLNVHVTRIYLPATAADIDELHRTGELPVEDAYAVTDELRAELAEDGRPADEEYCEYVALSSAAYASLLRLTDRPADPDRRAAVSADVPAKDLRAVDTGVYEVLRPVALREVAAVHVDGDGEEVRELVARARGELASGGDAEATSDSLDGHDLEWYDPSELAELCAELG